jgi:hypothetical protein
LPGGKGDGGSIFWKTREIGLPSYNDLSTGKMIHEKNRKSKISCQTPFKFGNEDFNNHGTIKKTRLFLLPWTLAPLRLMSHKDKTDYWGQGVAVLAHENGPEGIAFNDSTQSVVFFIYSSSILITTFFL